MSLLGFVLFQRNATFTLRTLQVRPEKTPHKQLEYCVFSSYY